MKKILMPLTRCAIVLAIFLTALFCVSPILSDKSSRQKYKDFFEAEHEYDVIFLGTSHMYNTVSCMQLWQDYGIASYNFGYSNCRMTESYWMLRHLLRYTKPRAVVIDLYHLEAQDKYRGDTMEQRHVQFDSMPLDLLKIQAVLDEFGDYEHWLDFIWPFAKYHSRWDALSEKDFHIVSTHENGSDIKIGLHGVNDDSVALIDAADMRPVDALSFQYLRKISDLCAKENIELLLLVVPYSICTAEDQRAYNYAAAALAAPHVSYLNMVAQENIHYLTDSYDADHMNMAGSCKVTDTLGAWLSDELAIPNHTGDERFAQMDEVFRAYSAMRAQQLRDEQNPTNYLLRLYDSCFLYDAHLPESGVKQLNEKQQLLLSRAQYSLDETLSKFSSESTLLEIDVYDRISKTLIDRVQLTDSRVIR